MNRKKAVGLFNLFWEWYFDKPLRVFSFFRERIGELFMATFILYNAEKYAEMRKLLNILNNAILAEFFIVNPALLFNIAFPQFYNDPVMRSFIEQNKYLNKLLEEYRKIWEEEPEKTITSYLLSILCSITPFPFVCNILAQLLIDPKAYGREYANQIDNVIQQNDENIHAVSQEILNKYNKKAEEIEAIRILPSLAITLCPVLPYVVPTVLAHVRLLQAYKDVKVKPKEGLRTSQLLPMLLAELYLDDKLYSIKTLDKQGEAEWQIPKQIWDKISPKSVTVDIFGMRKTYELFKPPSCEWIERNFSYARIGWVIWIAINRTCSGKYTRFDLYGDWDYYKVYLFDSLLYEGSDPTNCIAIVPNVTGKYRVKVEVYAKGELYDTCYDEFYVYY